MIFISIMILIVVIALHSLSPVLLTRISAIVFIYAGVLSLNALDIQSIGSGIGIYSGLFHVTTVSQLIDTFIFILGFLILIFGLTLVSLIKMRDVSVTVRSRSSVFTKNIFINLASIIIPFLSIRHIAKLLSTVVCNLPNLSLMLIQTVQPARVNDKNFDYNNFFKAGTSSKEEGIDLSLNIIRPSYVLDNSNLNTSSLSSTKVNNINISSTVSNNLKSRRTHKNNSGRCVRQEKKELLINKDIFDLITKDVYLNEKYFNINTFKIINKFKFITSLQLSDLKSTNLTEDKNIIYSSVYYIGDIEYKHLSQILQNKTYSNDLHILNVSWIKTIDLTEVDIVNNLDIPFSNVHGEKYKIFIYNMSYIKFFKILDKLFDFRSDKEKNSKYLGINPIIIFNGLSKGNIIHLFKLHNINLNGGSISRRHKLSITEYRLSIFIDLIDLFQENKEEFLSFYKENRFSSKFYIRPSLKKEVKLNPYINHYNIMNNLYSLAIEKFNLNTTISKLNQGIEKFKIDILDIDNSIVNNNLTIETHINKISSLKNKFKEGISTKHKASLSGRIKSNHSEIENLKHKNIKLEQVKLNLTKNLDINYNKLNNLKSKLENVTNILNESKSGVK